MLRLQVDYFQYLQVFQGQLELLNKHFKFKNI